MKFPEAFIPAVIASFFSIFAATVPTTAEAAAPSQKKSHIVKQFEPVCDTLDSLITIRTSVAGELELKAVMKRGNSLDFYFTRSLGDLPWTAADARWFKEELKRNFPAEYAGRSIGSIYSNRVRLEKLITPEPGFSGSPSASAYMVKNHRTTSAPLVENRQKPTFRKGLDNMHIALWQSHGRYYEQETERWEWQRPCLFQTSEDLFTQSFVLPFLVPMLENAGACVLLPRERDVQTNEVIVDNDPSFERIPGERPVRYGGKYSESGKWTKAGTGFADPLPVYEGLDNPFEMGTARMAECIQDGKKSSTTAEARWTPDIPERGEYAVYVSYRSLPNSTTAARYTVRHLGGESIYIVNQKIGGGTWIYLGTHEFAKGTEGCVILDNITPEGKFKAGSVISADAVKIGGGMGNIARKAVEDSSMTAEVSGLPRFVEGARYWMQWAGTDSSIFSQNEQKNDYMDDFMSRGAWVSWLSGGSSVNPGFSYPPAVRREKKSLDIGKGIPVDLSFGFHSDAGTTPNDSTVGTLAIYTLKCENSQRLPDGEDRMTSREYAYLVQSQIVNDIRAEFAPDWNRRWIWDRSYSECRTPSTPAMLLEMLSHQNFADMRYGLDPAFRFTVSRAVYKGMLKYLSNRYGREYAVQPLPVRSFAAMFTGWEQQTKKGRARIRLSWTEPVDSLEPTAVPEGYILYTRIDTGAFDNGRVLKNFRKENGRIHYDTAIEPGHIYSYRITAYNSGGESFPSETLSAGVPENTGVTEKKVLVVNNFDRVSAPVSFDTPQYAGFDNRIDSGVPYMRDISFSGEMYQFRRDMEWTDDDNPGFGASESDFAGKVIAGNTFDYPYVHGKAIMKAGYPFCSASAEAFAADSTLQEGFWSMDLICGKQVTVRTGNGRMPDRYRVFPETLQAAIRTFTSKGGNVLISGANIGTDIWDKVYEVECDSTFRAESIKFAEKVLGYRWITGFGGKSAKVKPYGKNSLADALRKETAAGKGTASGGFSYNNRYDSRIYRVEAPDGLAPVPAGVKKNGSTATCIDSGSFLRYSDTGISAATYYDTGLYRTVAIGFPIETVCEEEAIDSIIETTLKFFEK